MGDLATLLTAIAALVTSIGASVAGLISALRTSRRERPAAAREAVKELLDSAASDGVITKAELARLQRELRMVKPIEEVQDE